MTTNAPVPFQQLFPISTTEAALILGDSSSGAHAPLVGAEPPRSTRPAPSGVESTASAVAVDSDLACFDRISGDTFISLLRHRAAKQEGFPVEKIEISAVGGSIDAPAAVYAEVLEVFVHALDNYCAFGAENTGVYSGLDSLMLSIKETYSYIRIELSFPLRSEDESRSFRNRLLGSCNNDGNAKHSRCFFCSRDALHARELTVAVQFGNNNRVNVAVERPLKAITRYGIPIKVGSRVLIVNCNDIRAVESGGRSTSGSSLGKLKSVNLFAALGTEPDSTNAKTRLILQTRLNPIVVEVDSVGSIVAYQLSHDAGTEDHGLTIPAVTSGKRPIELLDADRLNLH